MKCTPRGKSSAAFHARACSCPNRFVRLTMEWPAVNGEPMIAPPEERGFGSAGVRRAMCKRRHPVTAEREAVHGLPTRFTLVSNVKSCHVSQGAHYGI